MPTDENSPDTVGVVLAGGRSTRFGDGNKAFAQFDGQSFIERIVETIDDATNRPPVVVARTSEQRAAYEAALPATVRCPFDAANFEGPLAGVVGASAVVDARWLFVCGCDMPLLSGDAIEWLATRLSEQPDDVTALTVRRPDGTPEPMHAFYRRDAIAAVEDRLPRTGGVRTLPDVVASCATIPLAEAPDDARLVDSLSNVNTREELAAVKERVLHSDFD